MEKLLLTNSSQHCLKGLIERNFQLIWPKARHSANGLSLYEIYYVIFFGFLVFGKLPVQVTCSKVLLSLIFILEENNQENNFIEEFEQFVHISDHNVEIRL